MFGVRGSLLASVEKPRPPTHFIGATCATPFAGWFRSAKAATPQAPLPHSKDYVTLMTLLEVSVRPRHLRSFYLVWLALLLPPSVLPALAWEHEPLSVFHERRARLVRETGGDGVIVLFGYRDADVAASVTTFHQNENFYYLTGWNEPDAVMLLVPKAPKPGVAAELEREVLFMPARNLRAERWTGPKLGPEDPDASARTGFPTLKATSLLQSELLEALKSFSKIYAELTPQLESGEDYFQAEVVSKLRKIAPLANIADVRPHVERQRAVKSPA